MNREAIMTALFNLLVGSIVVSFTGDTHSNTTIDNLSSTHGLFLGLPVFGLGVPRGAVIAAIGSSSITLSLPATASAAGVSFQTGFLTTGRRLLRWTAVSAQPALFLRDASNEYPARSTIVFEKPVLDAEVWIYSMAGENPDIAPTIALNCILDAIDTVMMPTAPGDVVYQRLTLGGLAQHCWIEGRVEIDAGDLDKQAKAVVPIKILVV